MLYSHGGRSTVTGAVAIASDSAGLAPLAIRLKIGNSATSVSAKPALKTCLRPNRSDSPPNQI